MKPGVQSEEAEAAPLQQTRGTLRLRGNQVPQQLEKRQLGEGTQRFKLGPLSFGRPQSAGSRRPNDDQTVFVAGATGRLGARIVRQLLLQGFTCASNRM